MATRGDQGSEQLKLLKLKTAAGPGLYDRLLRKTNAPALIALLVIAVCWAIIERQQNDLHVQQQRSTVLAEVSLIRAKLEGNINGNLQLVRGLVAAIGTEPDMDQQRFEALGEILFESDSQLRSLAGARDLVVNLMYPLEGNRQAIGLDYRRNGYQRGAALRARDTGEMILAGPVDLVQGGQAFIGRFPVFVHDHDGSANFWGIVSAVIDIERLYAESGLTDPDLSIELTLSGSDATGGRGTHFFGDDALLDDAPVTADITLPSGSWQIAARPRGGWTTISPDIWQLRLWMFLAAALIMVPTVLTGRLMDERQKNIGELSRRERELQLLSRRLRLALDASKVGVWEVSLGETDEFWDNRMNELYGYPQDGAPRNSSHWEARVHPEDVARARAEFSRAMGPERTYSSQYRLIMENGAIRHVRAVGMIYQDPGEPERLIGVAWDISDDVNLQEELRQANAMTEARNVELESTRARIEHNALHDSLTGLPNRRHLDEVLSSHAVRFRQGEEVAALLQIDLDRFKQINDTLGHMAGDAMLIHAAEVLRATVQPDDFVARVGGDEFVVVRRVAGGCTDLSTPRLTRLAERIIQRMSQPISYQGHECRVGVSIGIATELDSDADPERLLVNADIALYRAKDRGRNRYQFFNEALHAEILTSKRVADDILTAIEQRQFIAHYQPQFCAETLDVIGVEALARWQHPTDGLLAPAAFMRIAEDLNVVGVIDRMILDHTLRDYERWQKLGVGIPKVSVNVSARRLQDEELIQSLRDMNIAPGTVSFELVESIFLDDNDELTTWNVDQIKELGIDIEIDDFGTGYASIVSLMKLKPRRLKIDRQFIKPIVHSPGQRQLVGSIIDIGRSLGIEVLAEGVETMEHAHVLRKLGCNALQGYAFARPLGDSDLIDFVQSRRWREAS